MIKRATGINLTARDSLRASSGKIRDFSTFKFAPTPEHRRPASARCVQLQHSNVCVCNTCVCVAVFLANFWVFWALFPLSMNPLEPSGAPERSSRAEHCGVSRKNLMKVLLVALHLRHFQEFLGDLCDHFIVTKRGVSNEGCCHFMKIVTC